MLEGVGKLAGILEALAERELEADALSATHAGKLESPLHGLEVGAIETERLEVGKARVGEARSRSYGERPAERLDRPRLLAQLPQKGAVHDPRLLFVGVIRGHLFHQR